jgi:anti-anti-sigma factor
MIDPLRIEQHGQVPVGRLSGEVDISAVPVVRDRLLRVLDNHGEGLVIDLTDTTYIDSAVVNMLFELAERLGLHQLRLVVVVPEDGLVDRVLTIVDLSSVADVYRRFDDAIQAFGTEPSSPASPPPARP